MKFVFFHKQKPKGFEIKPRYYDKKKEENEERLKRLGLKDSDSKERLRLQMRKKWGHEGRDEVKAKSTRLMLIYIAIILIVLYFLFFR